jgi:predicted nucleic acid-binding protein
VIVADVNLLSYVLMPGEHTETASAVLIRDAIWAFPYLWRFEFRNILAMQIRHRGMSLDHALLIWDNAASLARRREFSTDPRTVLELVADHSLTAYDAEYVALAKYLQVPLVTFDRKLITSATGTAISAEEFLRREI